MSFGGWGGGRFVKVGFWVEGCTDWHTQTKWRTHEFNLRVTIVSETELLPINGGNDIFNLKKS